MKGFIKMSEKPINNIYKMVKIRDLEHHLLSIKSAEIRKPQQDLLSDFVRFCDDNFDLFLQWNDKKC